MAERLRRHPGAVAVGLLCVAAGAALLLAYVYHLGVPAMLAAILLGLPGLFLAWRAIQAAPPVPDLAPVAEQLRRAVDRAAGDPGRAVAGRAVSLSPRPGLLAGREDLLAVMHDRLADGGGPRTVALCGMGGAGKTSLALEYAHRHLPEVGMAWQLPAEDPAVLGPAMAVLAGRVGAGGRDADPVTAVRAALADRDEPWLLIFDNAPDEASVRPFLPAAGPGRIVITSQNPAWPAGQALDVPVLGTGAAARFLMTRTGDADPGAAMELAGELGGLPLALEQAAAYTLATGSTLAGYAALYADRQADLLARGQPAGYDKTVATTWAVAAKRLDHDAPAASGLLRLLACLASEPVPFALLLATSRRTGRRLLGTEINRVIGPLLGDPVAVADAVAALRRYSLATPAGDGMIVMHRLVQAVTTAQMTSQTAARWRSAAASLVEAAIPADPGRPESWPACAALLPHAQAVLSLTSGGIWRIASYLGLSGSYQAARNLWQKVAEAYEAIYGAEHLATLAVRGSLGAWTGEAGDPAAARDMFATLLPVRERVSGADHPDTLVDRTSLARWTGEAGDPAAARDMFAALLPDMERVQGAEARDTLIDRANLARFTGEAGDPAAARDMFTALLPDMERVLGAKDWDSLAARADLAACIGQAGDPAAARDMFAALLLLRERVQGGGHPDTLVARASLARWTGEAGDPPAAQDLYAALLRDMEQVLGAEHPDTLAARGSLAYWSGQGMK